ncbi:MAG TPA: hypothetical protein VM925_35910 [Labilithrix sp.]|nr:hypothetical protein [Labilithrix sp.]
MAPRRRLFAIVLAIATTLVAGIVACSSSSSTTIPPTTGILIRAETLTAGRGCGPGPTQLRKYAVVVYSINPALAGTPAEGDAKSYDFPLTGNVFDCYADGAFISLPSTAGNSTFRLEVYAYSEDAYEGSAADIERAGLAADATTLRIKTPTWTTDCIATQQTNVQALANCGPLRPGLSGLGGQVGPTKITLETSTFKLQEGRLATCATAPPPDDAGTDAATDAGQDADVVDGATDAGLADAEAGAPVDAGPPLTFAQVRVRPRINATIVGPEEVVSCPTPYVADVTSASGPATYQLDVELLDSAGNLVSAGARTVCTVTTRTGETSPAKCP